MKRKVLVELWAHGGEFEVDFDKWDIISLSPTPSNNILVVLVSKDGSGK